MSTAARFLFPRSFPLCVPDPNGAIDPPGSYVDNLTLTEVMAFYWNVETLTLTTVGTAIDTIGVSRDLGDVLVLAPNMSSLIRDTVSYNGCAWYGDSITLASFASAAQAFRQPIERMCLGTGGAAITAACLDVGFSESGSGTYHDGNDIIHFWLRTDPLNVDRYRIYYYLDMYHTYNLGTGIVAAMFWTHVNSSAPHTLVPATSGTFTISGIAFPYYSFVSNFGHTGGTLSASSSNFTY